MRAWPVQASPGHCGAERAVRTRRTTGRDVWSALWTAVHVLARAGARRCFPERLIARKRSGWVQFGAWKVGSILNQSSICRRAAHRAPADRRTCACRLTSHALRVEGPCSLRRAVMPPAARALSCRFRRRAIGATGGITRLVMLHHPSCRQAVARLMPRAVSSPISACRCALATHACRTAAVSPLQRSASRHRLFRSSSGYIDAHET